MINNTFVKYPSKHHLYNTWRSMINRCTNKKSNVFHLYGGRGITVCDRWLTSFNYFLDDMGLKPDPSYSLDRIDNDGNYSKENCRWVSMSMQGRNRRTKYKWKGYQRTRHGNFIVRVIIKRKIYYFGSFSTEIEAAKIYDIKAKELLGNDAVLNFP